MDNFKRPILKFINYFFCLIKSVADDRYGIFHFILFILCISQLQNFFLYDFYLSIKLILCLLS